jgi:50S ribosomal subunit-associated GTPase HflX
MSMTVSSVGNTMTTGAEAPYNATIQALQTQIGNLQATEASLIQQIAASGNGEDTNALEKQLQSVRKQIDKLQQQLQQVEQQESRLVKKKQSQAATTTTAVAVAAVATTSSQNPAAGSGAGGGHIDTLA